MVLSLRLGFQNVTIIMMFVLNFVKTGFCFYKT